MKMMKNAGEKITPDIWYKQDGNAHIYTINPMSLVLRILVIVFTIIISAVAAYIISMVLNSYDLPIGGNWLTLIVFGLFLLPAARYAGNISIPYILTIYEKEKLIGFDLGDNISLHDIAMIDLLGGDTPSIVMILKNQNKINLFNAITPLQQPAFKRISVFLWQEIQKIRDK